MSDPKRIIRIDPPSAQVPWLAPLNQADPRQLQAALRDEHPQTVAVILSQASPALGTRILAGLTPQRKADVVHRAGRLAHVHPGAVHDIAKVLGHQLLSPVVPATDRGHSAAGHRQLDGSSPEVVRNPTVPQDERSAEPASFATLAGLSNRDIRLVLRHTQRLDWSIALIGADQRIARRVLGNMSSADVTWVRQQMVLLGPVRQAKVDAVRRQIARLIDQLCDARIITGPSCVAGVESSSPQR